MAAGGYSRAVAPIVANFVPRRTSSSSTQWSHRGRMTALILACAVPLGATRSFGADAESPEAAGSSPIAIHGQLTYVDQQTNSFYAPYRGQNSLTPDKNRETADVTIYLGARLWQGAEAWINPELDQGFGLDGTLGVAGFPSAEAYKVGSHQPYFRLPRLFLRQTLNQRDLDDQIDADLNQMAATRSSDRWVFTVGKFGVTDVFDVNQYAHDPRGDFLNWSAVDAGTCDYAADAWGFTLGVSAEWYRGAWTLRAGFFDLSDVPNSESLDPGFHQFQLIGEGERRYELFGRSGKLLLTAYQTYGRMGLLEEAVQHAGETDAAVDIAAVRQFRSRYGASLSWEQELVADVGLFARAGEASGNVEAFEFTDIDRTLELGLSLKGSRWHRMHDTFGIVAIDNGISAAREQYLNAGGLGILVGDGKLPDPGSERIVETYYSLNVIAQVFVTADFQRIVNPAYNRDRGPVSVAALRVHAEL